MLNPTNTCPSPVIRHHAADLTRPVSMALCLMPATGFVRWMSPLHVDLAWIYRLAFEHARQQAAADPVVIDDPHDPRSFIHSN